MSRRRRSFHSRSADMLREANDANKESMATGVPLDEVTDMRADRRAVAAVASAERLETYNDAARRAAEHGAPEDHVDKWIAMGNLRLGQNATHAQALEGDAREFRAARAFAGIDSPVTRRALLKGAAAGGLSLAALGALNAPKARAATGPTIAIIGGGLAGLRCAHSLWNDRGWASNLYEANPDFGGRCETNRGYFSNNQIADCHGESISSEHDSMLNLVSLFNLQLEDTDLSAANGRVTTYWVNGHRYTQAQVNADWQSTYYTKFHNAIKAAPFPQSYNKHNSQGVTWDNQNCITWMNNNFPGGANSDFGAVCQQMIRDEFGGEPSDSSALDLIFILGYDDSTNNGFQPTDSPVWAGTDERWHVKGGTDQIVSGMISQIPASQLHANVALVKINNNGRTSGPYTLTLQPTVNGQPSGSTYQVTVKSLVLSNPFASMRNKVDLTKAGFTSRKMNAINNLGMGTCGKIFMQFNGHPWQNNGYSGVSFQDNGPPYLSSGWEVPNNDYAGATSIWCAYPAGDYTPQILSTYGITQHNQQTPAQCVTDSLARLETVFPGVTAAYNGKSWSHFGNNDPWVQGAYSYYRVGQCTSFGGYESVKEGYVHFAGEHTSRDFQGFMEGAVTSGERCASEITTSG